MAKNHQTENALFKALVKKYEAQIAHAYATLLIYFDSVNNQAGNIAEDLNVISDFVDLTVTAGHMKEIIRAIVQQINQGPHSDGVIVLGDMSTTTLADETVNAQVVHPEITAVNAITVASAFS